MQAPATVANVGPGFDVLGLALEGPADIITLSRSPKPGVKVRVLGRFAKGIPSDFRRNAAGVVAWHALKRLGLRAGLRLTVVKEVPPSVGLGSSGASAAGAAVAVNQLLDLRLDSNALIGLAAKGEKAAAGAEHADNVAASILGGLIIIRSYDPLDVARLGAPRDLLLCIATPKIPTPPQKTAKARAVLPKAITLQQLVHNTGHLGALVAGFAKGDIELIGRAMSDSVVEPARARMIPGYLNVRENALKFGAKGVAMSGAGPSMVALVDGGRTDPITVCEAMREGFRRAGVASTAFHTRVGQGARVVER